MANALYRKGAQAILNKEIDFNSDTLKVSLLAAGYTPDINNHDFFDDLTNVVAIVVLRVLRDLVEEEA